MYYLFAFYILFSALHCNGQTPKTTGTGSKCRFIGAWSDKQGSYTVIRARKEIQKGSQVAGAGQTGADWAMKARLCQVPQDWQGSGSRRLGGTDTRSGAKTRSVYHRV